MQIVIAVLALAMSLGAAELPPIPPLPETGWPTLRDAEPFARALIDGVTPAALDAHVAQHPDDVPAIFRNLGSALLTRDASLSASLDRYLNAFTRVHAKRETDIRMLVSLQLVDPVRFFQSAEFHDRVLRLLPHTLDASTSLALRTACLREMNSLEGFDFDSAEKVAVGWGVVPRSSAERRIAFRDDLRMPDDVSGPIVTSIYSLNSTFVKPEEAKALLAAVRKASPKRRILVLTDESMQGVERVETFSRPFTPWPRDPFSVARDADGGIVFVSRPNLQPDREEDANMVRALVQGAPFESRWTVAPTPFHNGHVLLTPSEAWISIHSVEVRALQLLGLSRVPAESFDTRAGVERYLAAVRKAAKELEELYRRPVKFVHPLDPDPALMRKLAGGGGFDLDSIVMMLPQSDGTVTALVGDISLGAKYAVPRAYGVKGEVLPARELDAFLDLAAASLASRGVRVLRLPLMLVNAQPKPFLITWTNVVLETRRAEGFASLIEPADALARTTFAKAGYTLDLYPPLIRSIVLSGGYRCASNHVRP